MSICGFAAKHTLLRFEVNVCGVAVGDHGSKACCLRFGNACAGVSKKGLLQSDYLRVILRIWNVTIDPSNLTDYNI